MNKDSLDLSYLKGISKGNKEFELKMLKTFVEQTSSEMEKIQISFQNKEWDALGGAAHKIKPSFHFIGELETEKLLTTIEGMAKQKNELEKLPGLVDIFLKSCKQTLENVKVEIEKYNSHSK